MFEYLRTHEKITYLFVSLTQLKKRGSVAEKGFAATLLVDLGKALAAVNYELLYTQMVFIRKLSKHVLRHLSSCELGVRTSNL